MASLATGTGTGKKTYEVGQECPHDSEKRVAYYGLRNTVESQNAYIKESSNEDIADRKRRGAGNTFASLAETVALASANIGKILPFIRAHLSRTTVSPQESHV